MHAGSQPRGAFVVEVRESALLEFLRGLFIDWKESVGISGHYLRHALHEIGGIEPVLTKFIQALSCRGNGDCVRVGTKGGGRDHNPKGFSMWMAGGGVKGGLVIGSTDEFGYIATENRVHVHDLHATMLHLLGLDHTLLTYFNGGRNMRLTDVHGRLVKEIIA